jgi:ribose 5-phosphate isomerase RpiB
MEGDTIAVAADHVGFDLGEIPKRDLQEAGYAVCDFAIEFEGGRHVACIAKIS